jgi:DeoR family transcriptional regulator, aga operon transcriptional repressor
VTPAPDASRREVRLRAIIELVDASDHPFSIEALATELSASPATIRRDVTLLARQNLVSRAWGRVGRLGSLVEQPIGKRQLYFRLEKKRIAAEAARLIPDGAVVGLTGGTTTLAVARAIASRERLTVVTNSLTVGVELAPRPNIRLVMSGGVARNASFELSGPIATSSIDSYNLDLAVVGVDGIGVSAGCTTYDEAEAAVNAVMVARARRTVVVADASKLGQAGFARICALSAVELVITDVGASDAVVAEFEGAGVEVRRV